MSAPIESGVWIEVYRGADSPPLYVGRVYFAERVWDGSPEWGVCSECVPGVESPCVELRGVKNPDGTPWCGCGMCPIYRPKSEIIQSLLQPAPTRETEDA